MTFDWLKTLLGDAYTEDIDKTVATEIGKRFTAKADFEAKSTELKNAKAQLAEANETIEGLQAADKDIEAVRKEAAEYKAKAEQAEKDAAEQLDAYKFDTWFDGLVAQNHGRDGAVIRTLAGTERMDALRKSQNRDASLCRRHRLRFRCGGRRCHARGHGPARREEITLRKRGKNNGQSH